MFDPVGSTSWPNRHRPYLLRLNERLRAELQQRAASNPALARPLVALIGPGAVTRLCRPLLRDAARHQATWRALLGDLARYSDQLLRRIPSLPLVSLEALEVEAALTIPHELAVVDVSQRVLAAVARDLPAARCARVDLSREPIPFDADVIIAFNVVSRIEDGRSAANRLVDALRSGGLLLMDDRSADRFLTADRFVKVAEKTHRKR